MTYDELQKKTAELYASGEVYTSPDFQCDQTGGFPTSLCVCWEKQKAWLELNENILMDRDDMELSYYRDLCAITVSAPAATLRTSITCSEDSARTLSEPPSCFPMRTKV